MKIRNWKNPLGWLMMLFLTSCVEPYFPEVLESPNSFLVVNGFLNANGLTNIQLLRTQSLTDNSAPPAELQANVVVESERGEKYTLAEGGYGNYTSHLYLNPDIRYKIRIRTAAGKEYESDFVEVKQTPAIDKVHWRAAGDELKIYVDTNDPNNNTHYYRWEFEETWQFRSALYSTLKYENGSVRYRDSRDAPIYNCWRSESSKTIELGNSSKLSSDVISNYNIVTLPFNAEKISVKYSVLVKQFALTREAYEYWETVKKNTESIGTLFDPLPTQITSNIRSLSDPNEPVIGFMTAATIQTKRLFVDSKDLPQDWRLYYAQCAVDSVLISSGLVHDRFAGGSLVPVDEIYGVGPMPIGYTFAPKPCVDCTTRGTNVTPYFWE